MEKIDNVGSYLLKADIETIKETMDLINELNDNLKRAKTLIDELAQKKLNLELNFTSSLQEDQLEDIPYGYYPLKSLNKALLVEYQNHIQLYNEFYHYRIFSQHQNLNRFQKQRR